MADDRSGFGAGGGNTGLPAAGALARAGVFADRSLQDALRRRRGAGAVATELLAAGGRVPAPLLAVALEARRRRPDGRHEADEQPAQPRRLESVPDSGAGEGDGAEPPLPHSSPPLHLAPQPPDPEPATPTPAADGDQVVQLHPAAEPSPTDELAAARDEAAALRARLAERRPEVASERSYDSGAHTLFVGIGQSYRTFTRPGAAPPPGATLELEGRAYRVVRVGPSPFPGTDEACAFLEALADSK